MADNRWWVATDALARGGEKIVGPFESQELALAVRAYVEASAQGRTFWVDEEPSGESVLWETVAWRCDQCGARGAVQHEPAASVYEVLDLLRADHLTASPGCHLDLARVRVEGHIGQPAEGTRLLSGGDQ